MESWGLCVDSLNGQLGKPRRRGGVSRGRPRGVPEIVPWLPLGGLEFFPLRLKGQNFPRQPPRRGGALELVEGQRRSKCRGGGGMSDWHPEILCK